MFADGKKANRDRIKVLPARFHPIADHLKVIPGSLSFDRESHESDRGSL